MTLALYLAFLVSKGENSVYLPTVLHDFAQIEAFNLYVQQNSNGLSNAAIAEVRAGKKISAIKIVRQERFDAGKESSLKTCKDIVDEYVRKNPNESNPF